MHAQTQVSRKETHMWTFNIVNCLQNKVCEAVAAAAAAAAAV